ncbi:MAG: succinate dehydrogenase assembly factor 2 [Gammaproteobacteria bacterium]|nr:succinate dehydrogenase assembly factor 2 [Gammaproteobacteria bacterium]
MDLIRKQLKWRCRRGMRELDAVFGGYLERAYDALPAEQQRLFARLLDESDPTLYAWVTGRTSPDDAALAAQLRQVLDDYHAHLLSERAGSVS